MKKENLVFIVVSIFIVGGLILIAFNVNGEKNKKDNVENIDVNVEIENKITYTVTFDSNGGSNVESQIVEAGKYAKLVEPTKENYIFGGWYNGEERFYATDEIISDITLVAKWLMPYIVTFDSNGGSNVESQIVGEGENLAPLPIPTRDGYIFDYWEYKGERWYSTDKVTKNITLKAIWIEREEPFDLEVSVKEMSDTYYNNELDGNKKYFGKIVKTQAYFKRVDSGWLSTLVYFNGGTGSIYGIYCSDFSSDSEFAKVSTLSRGQKVTIIGRVDELGVGYINFKSCKIIR